MDQGARTKWNQIRRPISKYLCGQMTQKQDGSYNILKLHISPWNLDPSEGKERQFKSLMS